MKPYQQRVVEEKEQLDEKKNKLGEFLESDEFKAVDSDEQHRLTRQHQVMGEYSKILGERIGSFVAACPSENCCKKGNA